MSKLTTPVTSIISVIQAWIVKYVIKVKFGGLHTLFTFVQKRRKKHSCSNILFHFWILILLCSLCKNFFVLTLNRMCKYWLVFDYMDLWSYLGVVQDWINKTDSYFTEHYYWHCKFQFTKQISTDNTACIYSLPVMPLG